MTIKISKKQFYFVRHGETDWNKKRIYQGNSDIELNENGIKQAISAAKIIKKENIKYIVSSPLLRAKKTAEIISNHLHIPFAVIDELKELSLGEKEGQPINNNDFFANWLLGVTPKGGESVYDFDQRVIKGFLKGLAYGGPVLFVAHGGVFTAIRKYLNLPLDRIENCQVVYHETTDFAKIPWISTVIET